MKMEVMYAILFNNNSQRAAEIQLHVQRNMISVLYRTALHIVPSKCALFRSNLLECFVSDTN